VKRRLASLVYSIPLLLFLCACDGGTNIRGYVRDPKGQPIPGASVTLTVRERITSASSNAQGYYHVGMIHSPFRVDETLVAYKDGFVPFRKEFSSHDHLQNVDITLRPAR